MTIGERVKKVRKEIKMNQVEFSRTLGISQGNLSDIDAGKTKPSFDFLYQLANTYKVDLNWLVFSSNNALVDDEKLLIHFHQLEKVAQEEVLDYIMMKLKRYKRT